MQRILAATALAGLMVTSGCGWPGPGPQSGAFTLGKTPATYGLQGDASPEDCACACEVKIVGDIKATFPDVEGVYGFNLNTQASHLVYQPPGKGKKNQKVELGVATYNEYTGLARVVTKGDVTIGEWSGPLAFAIYLEPQGNHLKATGTRVMSAGPFYFDSLTTENRGLNVFVDCPE